MHESATTGKLAEALAAVQAALPAARRDAQNPHLKSRYADLGSVWDACRDLLPSHGLAIIQRGVRADGEWMLETRLVHTSGEWICGAIPLLCGENRGTSAMQSLGSAITYARRYGLAAMVGVVADEDDDGHAAGHREPPRRAATSPAPRVESNGSQRPSPNESGPTWGDALARALAKWEGFEPSDGNDRERTSRTFRLANDLVTQAIAAGHVREERVCHPLLDGEKTLKRDLGRVINCCGWLLREHRTFALRAMQEHLDRLAREILGPGAEG